MKLIFQKDTDMLISMRDISIRVGSQTFFEHTSWEIQKDQHWAILGPTGSGKTILAKAVARQMPLVHGEIRYFFDGPGAGRPYLNRHEIAVFSSETHREFLRQFVDYHQARWQSFEGQGAPTVSELLDSHSLLSHSPYEIIPPAVTEAFKPMHEAAVTLFDLGALLERKVHQLSHGESRKVFLTRLLLRSPKFLILDDPFIGLDESSRLRLRAALEKLLENQQPAVLLVTSKSEDIPAGINRVLLVDEKRVTALGERDLLLPRRKKQTVHARPTAVGVEDVAAFDGMIRRYAAAISKSVSLRSSAPPLIQMQDVSVIYGEHEVLKPINWTVRQGERWALLGANGAGKSTLLSLILADNPQAYRNSIFLFGQKRGSGESIWEIKQQIGWVSPELHIFYDRNATCRDVIASGFFDSVGLYTQCSDEQAAASSQWMRILGLEALAEQPFHDLSTGQQRMVLLGRAMVKNPPLLVLDEPCQGLDDTHRAAFVALVDEICARVPVTLIYVTHYRGEIPASITHCLKLEHGIVQEAGLVSLLGPQSPSM
jgi:molybdate transport system ATP-binding protein